MIHFPFFNCKMDYPQNSARPWAVLLLQASGAPPTSLGIDAGVSHCACWPRSWAQAGRVTGRVAFLAASPCSLHFFHHVQTHSRSHRESEKGRKQSCLGASLAGRAPFAGQGQVSQGQVVELKLCGALALREAPAVVPGCRGWTWAHSLDLQLTLKDQSQKWVRFRTGHIYYYLLVLVSLFVA